MVALLESSLGQEGLHLVYPIAATFCHTHQQSRISGHRRGTRFRFVQMCIMDDDQSAGRESRSGGVDQVVDFIGIPIMKDVGEEVAVKPCGQRVIEHITWRHSNSVLEVAFTNHRASNDIDRRSFKDSSGEVGVVSHQSAGVDAGSPSDIE